MKGHTKRLPALLLAILLCLNLLPATAWAAAPTTLIVGNTTVVEDGVERTISGAGWSYENGTLTLNGATIATAYTDDSTSKTYGIYADGNLNIELVGTSTVESSDTAFNYGVYINGSLTVSGTGSLTAGGTDYGVYVTNAMTANSGSITGNNTGTSDDDYGDGIYVGNTLTVDGGTVTGSGKSKSSRLNGAGIRVSTGGLTVSGGTVTGTAAGERSEGVYVKQGNLAVSGSGSVTGKGSGQWCQGIRLEQGNLEVSGGSVEGIANDANNQGYGIYLYYNCDLKVTGGTVTGNGCGQSGYGIIVESKITVEGGTVTGTCSDLYGTGIGAAQGLTVSGSGRVTGSGQSGYGIRAYSGDIRITGTDTYVEGTSGIPEYAIYVGTKYGLYVDDVRYEPSSVTEFKVENGQVTGAIEWTGSGNVWVNGVKITGDPDHTVTCGSGTAVYSPDTNTLTLKGAAVGDSYADIDDTYGIYAEGDLTLVLEESSTVESSDTAFDCGVCIEGDLTVRGSGSLTVKGAECGIYANNMTVESGTVEGRSSGSNGTGISVRDTLTMKGGSVTGTSTGSSSYGIDVRNGALTVSGGTVTGTGKTAGICLKQGALEVEGGSVTGEGISYGVDVAQKTLTVSGSGSVSGTATGNSGDGIYTKYSLTVSGGTVSGTATGDGGWGINVDSGSLKVTGGSVTGKGDSTGIYTGYGLTVNGGDVTGTGTSEGSCGIDTTTLKMTGGIVTGKGAGVAIVTYGDGEKTAQDLIVVPANYVPTGYGAQAVVVEDNNTYTYASFAETGNKLAYDSDTKTFTGAATEITLKAPGAVSFPKQFYASINFAYDTGYKSFGHVTKSGNEWMIYKETGDVSDRTIYGMEYAGGAIFTVEGYKMADGSDVGWRELRVYSSDLATSRTIGTVNGIYGHYWIVDTAMDLSGTEPVLYGTYQDFDDNDDYYSYICKISLTDGTPSGELKITGLTSASDIIYAIAFDEDGKLYAIGADAGEHGGPATLYTINKANGTATKVDEIKDSSGEKISTNFTQDLAYDYNTSTLYWMENAKEVLYTVDATSAVATKVGQVKHSDPPYLPQAYSVSAFCILDGTLATSGDTHMVSVIYDENVTVTDGSGASPKAVSMLGDGESLTLNITPDPKLGLWYVKVDGQKISITNPMDEITHTIQGDGEDHVIEVASRLPNPVTRVDKWDWLHYQGKTAKFYTQEITNKFYDWDRFNPDSDTPATGYTQTLLDNDGNDIDDDTILLPGLYGVRVTHPGTEKYAPLTLQYTDALDLAKCNGTPGRPVVYGKVGCTQGDLATTSALQDYYGGDGELIDAAHDEIPVTLEWLEPDTIYSQEGYFSAKATIYAAQDLDPRLTLCYNVESGEPLTPGCQIDPDDRLRNTQVVVLPANQASLIKLEVAGDEGGTVSGQGVFKNGDDVTVTATANINEGYAFLGWYENGELVSGAGATYIFTAEKDRTLTAKFGIDPEYLVKLQADPADGGTVTGGDNYKEDPHRATVSAEANKGYYFIGWYAAGSDEAVNTNTEYTFTVPEKGITLTAKFGVDYLALAEQTKKNFESAVDNNTLSWAILGQAVDAYQAAEGFVSDPPGGVTNPQDRFKVLTDYYNGIEELDLSNQDLGDADLTKLGFFSGVTELNLSGSTGLTDLTGLSGLTTLETLNLSNNKGVSDLSALKALLMLRTLDVSGTGVTALDSLITEGQSTFPGCKNLTAKNLSLTSISALAELVSAEGFNTDAITKWDFTGSTLTDSEENKADVKAIQDVLGDRFTPPTIKTTPDVPDVPVDPGFSVSEDDGYPVSVPASSSISGGAITVSPRSADEGDTVTITVKPDQGYELDTLTATDSKGRELELTDRGGGKYTFTMPDSSVKIQVSFREISEPAVNPFTDVSESAWYHDAVLWAVENGVTNGTNAEGTRFSPDLTVTRAQMVTFLWRACGSPAAIGSSPFADVDADAWYYDAVLWAVASGVTNGTSATTFSPDLPVSRAQAVTFQWRAAGSPAAIGSSPFADVDTDAWYYDAVLWAVASGVTNGTGDSHFSPDVAVTRAQAVTFLYREAAGA